MNWRDQFREDNELLLSLVGNKWFIRIYAYAGIITVAKQIRYRWDHCTDTLNCGLSFVKAAVWGSIWPVYWVNSLTDFVLLRPYG
jgi:hypothetical protein